MNILESATNINKELIDLIQKEIELWPIDRIENLFADESLTSREWIGSIDEILEEIELKESFIDHLYSMKELREKFLKASVFLTMSRHMIPIIRCTALFVIKAINATGAKTIDQFISLYETNEFIKRLFDQLLYTVQLAVLECSFLNENMFILDGYSSFTYEQSINARVTDEQKKEYAEKFSKVSPQVIKEFDLFMARHPLLVEKDRSCAIF